jgi:hypothetical protein
MANDDSALIIPFAQAPKKAPMSDAERAKNYRLRKKAKKQAAESHHVPTGGVVSKPVTPSNPGWLSEPSRGESVTLVTPSRHIVTPASRPPLSSILLGAAALGLAVVGITMNGWFSRSLGSSDIAGWLFLAIGVAADVVALVVPSCAARLWQARQRATAAAAWGTWVMTFVFAVTAGIGFASTNIADVTMSRASRMTPAVTAAQTALSDAMTARDRECKGGVGKFCRERESAVIDRRAALDAAMQSVQGLADPQADAAVHLVQWITHGVIKPTGDDFSMVRLMLLALLPQIGGILLMIGRQS